MWLVTEMGHEGDFWVADGALFLDSGSDCRNVFYFVKIHCVTHLGYVSFSLCMLNFNKNFKK